MFDALDISASALVAQRAQMDTIAQNVANIDTLRDEHGNPNPYRRRFVVLAANEGPDSSAPGVHVRTIEMDPSAFRKVYDPGHPDQDSEGNVHYPNVDLAIEQINMIGASRAYEANITMMEATKAMINASLRLLV